MLEQTMHAYFVLPTWNLYCRAIPDGFDVVIRLN